MSVSAPTTSPTLISYTTPLAANGTWTSPVQNIARATQITGSVYSDQPGTLTISQSGDGTNWDLTTVYNVPANTGVGIELDALEQFIRVTYTNGGVAQTVIRLYLNLRDVWGTFLATAATPSAGGAYLVLFDGPGGYQVVGRFDGLDPFQAISNAAIFNNKNGQYAAFVVANAIVAIETIQPTTTYTVGSF